MACTTEKTSPFPVLLKGGGQGNKGKIVRKYYVEVERCGPKGKYSFKTSVKRTSDDEIIARTTSTGFILFENLDEKEKPKEKTIKKQIRQAFTTAKNFAIGNNLTHPERTLFLNQYWIKTRY